jgi:hypothetical protein
MRRGDGGGRRGQTRWRRGTPLPAAANQALRPSATRRQGVVPAEELECGVRGSKQPLDRPVGDEIRPKNAVARPAGHEVEQVVGGAGVPLSRYRHMKHPILDPLQLYVH